MNKGSSICVLPFSSSNKRKSLARNETSNVGKSLEVLMRYTTFLVFLFLFLLPMSAVAGGTYYMTVGESKVLRFSTTRDIRTSTWVANSPKIEITSHGEQYAYIKAVESWTASSPLIVRCDYYYNYRSGNFTYTGIGFEDFYVYISPINPTKVSISTSKNLEIGGTFTLMPTLIPTNAETEYTWSSSNTSVATVSTAGLVKAIDAGSANITVRTSNGLTAVSQITVSQPAFSLSSTLPSNNSLNVQTNSSIWALFTLPLYQGSLFSSIYLSNEDKGVQVAGSAAISGKKLTFTPTLALDANTNYKFVIPSNALINQWGTAYASAVECKFKTGALDIISSTPVNNSNKVPVTQMITLEYNDDISAGQNYSDIQLQNTSDNSIVASAITINGARLSIKPNVNLKNRTHYKLAIPANSLTNKKSISHDRRDSITFTTIDKVILTASSSGGMISSGDSVKLYSNIDGASIYYTIDGSKPSELSTLYSGSIVVNSNLTLRAIAYKDGYEESEILNANYRALGLKVISCFPENNAKYVRNDVSLSYTFNDNIRVGAFIDSVSLISSSGLVHVPGKSIISGNVLFFVPNSPLDTNEIYKMTIPQGAVKNNLAEPNAQFTQQFTTGLVYIAVSAGRNYTTAIKSDETLWAWGNNSLGQLGDSTTTSKTTPVKVMSDVVKVSSTGYHTVAIKSNGSLWAWGCNYYGQLGNGTTVNSISPMHVMDDVVSVSADSSRTFAIKKDGSLWAWGGNANGRLGNGTLINRTTPVKILDSVIAVSAGGYHTMAIKKDGSLWAWGLNSSGRLGDGTSINKVIPVKIMDSVESVSAGNWHTMAIKKDGSLWAWGINTSGRLGDGTTTNRILPTKILDSVLSVFAGGEHTLAVKVDHSLWAWGGNSSNQLGDGTAISKTTPVKVLDSVSAISAGWDRSMGIKIDGTLWAWGANGSSQLGDGSTTNKTVPVQVLSNAITPATLTGIYLDHSVLELSNGRKTVLIVGVQPFNAEYKTIEWTSSDNNVATVSPSGVLTAISTGSATVTVTVTDGNGITFTADCNVTVIAVPALSGTISISGTLTYGQTLHADTSSLSATPVGTSPADLMFQWTRDGLSIPGESANKSFYELTRFDIGKNIGVSVSAMNCGGAISSNGINVVGKVSFDMTGIQFEDTTIQHDGSSHSLYIKGNLPSGVSVSEYVGNGKSDEGTYTVVVKFSVPDTVVYVIPADLSATLTIEQDHTVPLNQKRFTELNSPLSAWIHEGHLHVSGLTIGTPWYVYSGSGRVVYQGFARSNEDAVAISSQGRYFIKSLNHSTPITYLP